jgi:aspartyl-tRNA(Asn)/glutamyl-tRNA(Gln) amidotransferase subunit C
MSVSIKDVEHIAKLAKLKFNETELIKMAKELNSILDYINKLNEIDTSNVEPLSHVIDLKNVFREDKVKESYPVEEVLKNAPSKTNEFFKVPKVIG